MGTILLCKNLNARTSEQLWALHFHGHSGLCAWLAFPSRVDCFGLSLLVACWVFSSAPSSGPDSKTTYHISYYYSFVDRGAADARRCSFFILKILNLKLSQLGKKSFLLLLGSSSPWLLGSSHTRMCTEFERWYVIIAESFIVYRNRLFFTNIIGV